MEVQNMAMYSLAPAEQAPLGGIRAARHPMRPVEDVRSEWIGHQVIDVYGAGIGTARQVVIDPETDLCWLLLRCARFRGFETLVPAEDSIYAHGQLWLPYERDLVLSAPLALKPNAYRDGAYRSQLYLHYGLTGLRRRSSAGLA
jgi:hypothetical protein